MKKILAVVSLAMIMMASGCGGTASDTSGVDNSSSAITKPIEEQVLWDSDNVKVSFIEVFEYDYLPGYCYLKLRVENKSNKTITVLTKDAYANDTSITLGSGTPMELLPNKQSQTPFFFAYTNIGLKSIDEIETIEFKLWCVDDDFETVEETETLAVNLY